MKWLQHLGLAAVLCLAAAIAVAGPLAAQSAEQSKRIVFAATSHAQFAEFLPPSPVVPLDVATQRTVLPLDVRYRLAQDFQQAWLELFDNDELLARYPLPELRAGSHEFRLPASISMRGSPEVLACNLAPPGKKRSKSEFLFTRRLWDLDPALASAGQFSGPDGPREMDAQSQPYLREVSPDVVPQGSRNIRVMLRGSALNKVTQATVAGCNGEKTVLPIQAVNARLASLEVPDSFLAKPCVLRIMYEQYGEGIPLAVADADLARLKRGEPASEPFFRSLGDTPNDAGVRIDGSEAEQRDEPTFVLGRHGFPVYQVKSHRVPGIEEERLFALLPGVVGFGFEWDEPDLGGFWLGRLSPDGSEIVDIQTLWDMVPEPRPVGHIPLDDADGYGRGAIAITSFAPPVSLTNAQRYANVRSLLVVVRGVGLRNGMPLSCVVQWGDSRKPFKTLLGNVKVVSTDSYRAGKGPKVLEGMITVPPSLVHAPHYRLQLTGKPNAVSPHD